MVGDHRNPDVRECAGVGIGRTVGALIISFVLLLVGFAGLAEAAPETIAESGENAGQVNLPVGVAVHQASGDFYVVERNNGRISKFESNGKFLLAWGFGVRDGQPNLQTCGPQASPPQSWCFGQLFGSDNGAGNVLPAVVAVDQSSGDVFVADATTTKRRITKFTSSGEFVFLLGKNVNATKVALGGGATQAEKNICTAASGDICTAGASGTGPNEFASPRSLAITSSGVVWVGDTNRLKSFDADTGAPGPEIVLAGAGNTLSLAMNSAEDFYVKSASLPGIRKLAGPGAAVPGEQLATLENTAQGRTVTVDGADNIYVGDATSPYRFLKFNPAGEQIAQFGAGEVIGTPGSTLFGANAIAVGEAAEKLYVASSSSGAESAVQAFPLPEPGPLIVSQGFEDLEPTTVTLTARINPEGEETSYRFEYGSDTSYGESTSTQTLAAEAFESEDVAVGVKELVPSTTYHFRVVATNHCNPAEPAEECTVAGADQSFTTLPAVSIDPQWATNVTDHSAMVHAELDPLGVEAEAWLEYGTSPGYGQIVSLASLGNGFGAVERQAFLGGLAAATTYHYRFVARDVRDGVTYTVQGSDHTFTTQFGGIGFELPDSRVWEIVSPPDKYGARLVGGRQIHLQASADGDSLAYQSKLSTEADPEGNRILEPSMNLAHRDASGFWHSQDITTPNDVVTGYVEGVGTEYKLFNSDLSEALVEPRSGALLSPQASERTPYLRENIDPPAYTPLVTGKEPYANVPSGTKFGGELAVPNLAMAGVSPDFQHFALTSEAAALVAGAPASTKTIYEWSNGQIKPISVLPEDEGGAIVGATGVGSVRGSARGAVSEDGARVFWSSGSFPAFTALYVRDTEAEAGARLDIKRTGASGIGPARPIFQGASADGRIVFFTDSQQLTEVASPKGSDLYRCELPPDGIASGCATLTNISPPTGVGESSEVQGIAAAVTEDGGTIYFVARGVLDNTPNQYGDSAASGEANFYLWRQGEGIRYIATLSEEDRTDWGVTTMEPAAQAGALSAGASPSGRYFAFMSQRVLTGYDNRSADTGEPAQELFHYDALADQLECISCNPSGVRPYSVTPPGIGSLVNPAGLWAGQQTAATLPEAISISTLGPTLYRPRSVLDNGRVFFNAVDSLVPADSNGEWDVYQYEPTGAGDCLSADGASVSLSAGGCVSLLSSGTGEDEAAFFDASETGDDAFFFTPDPLSVLDKDEEVDIYDARVDGIAATLSPGTECLGDACQPLAQAPSDPTPASAVFQGPGNLRPVGRKHCPKGKRRVQRQGKVRCVVKKRHNSHKKRRKAGTHRGAGR